jgi:glycine/D-amino acid oxidase-like deaminating enzyme
MRNTVRYRPDLGANEAMRRDARGHHVDSFRKRFPMLEGVEFEHTWSGGLCMTANGGTIFGETAPGVFTSIAYNGLGLSRGTASGKALAELALGHDSDLLRDVQAMPKASRRIPEPFLGLGARSYISYVQWRGGAER